MSATEQRRAWVSKHQGEPDVIHTEKDCNTLQKKKRPARPDEVRELRECRVCSGEAPKGGREERHRCPKCGERTANLPQHMRGCSA